MEEIQDYEPRHPEVTRVEDGWIVAWMGDERPPPGTAIKIHNPDSDQTVLARTLDHRGAHRIGAQVVTTPDWLTDGLGVEPADSNAQFPPPDDGLLDLREASFVPDGPETLPFGFPDVAFADYDPARPAIETGHRGIDLLSPVALGGSTLILDNGPAPAGSLIIERLLEANELAGDNSNMSQSVEPFELVTPDTMRWWHVSADEEPSRRWRTIRVDEGRHEQWMGFRAATAWIAQRRASGRPSVFAADLPALRARSHTRYDTGHEESPTLTVSAAVNRLVDALASTTDAKVSCVLRLPLRESEQGADAIAETLPLGDVDTTIFVDESGRFDPSRSTSDAEIPDDSEWKQRRDRAYRALQTVRGLEEKRRIQGENALSDHERQAESLIDGLRRPLSG